MYVKLISGWRGRNAPPTYFLQIGLFLAALATAIVIQDSSGLERRNQTDRLYLNAEVAPHMILGYKLTFANILWIRLLQEIDYKDSKVVSKGWAYRMLDSITTLDPRFHMAYLLGVNVLSVLVRDVEGAKILYKRGVDIFPHDWSLAYKAGYHSLFEVKDCPEAARYMKIAEKEGAPAWVASLSSRLYAKSGQYELARSILVDALHRLKDSQYRPQLEKRLRELDDAYNGTGEATLISGLKCNP